MSERQEHKKRYNQKLEYIAKFEKWLDKEPPIINFFAWRKWKKQRPINPINSAKMDAERKCDS